MSKYRSKGCPILAGMGPQVALPPATAETAKASVGVTVGDGVWVGESEKVGVTVKVGLAVKLWVGVGESVAYPAYSKIIARGFTEEDFARSHPAGALGRRLLLHVKDVMRTGAALPKVPPGVPLAEGLMEMTRKGLGMTAIVDEQDRVLGVFTDGDLRRALDRAADLHRTRMDEVMTRQAKRIDADALAAEAVLLMETHRITSLIIVGADEVLVGALNVHDLLRAGVV